MKRQSWTWNLRAGSLLMAALLLAPAALAGGPMPDLGEGQLSDALDDGRTMYWRMLVEHEAVVLNVQTPCGPWERLYKRGEEIVFSPAEEVHPDDPDGTYTWQVRIVPVVDPAVRKELQAARESGDDEAVANLRRKGLLPQGPFLQTGSFTVQKGSIVPRDSEEEGDVRSKLETARSGATADLGGAAAATGDLEVATAADVVYNDDVIIMGSLCVGFDCVNGEVFSFDTIRLKENNLRIKFEDTSGGSFPSRDWEIEANSSTNGGQSHFRINDVDGARSPFTLEAAAPSHSLYVDSSGRVGLRTATPVLDLHISTSNTPAIRLEQTSAGGFTAQTWDIAGNEANFFVRDVTGGSRLPFRIRGGAPSNSVHIAGTGFVGLGTSSPDVRLDVEGTEDAEFRLTKITGLGAAETAFRTTATANAAFFGTSTNDVMAFTVNAVERMRITTAGRVSIGCADPSTDFVVQSTSDGVATCGTAPFSALTAGSTNFTASSSRAIKENIVPLPAAGILEKVAGIDVYSYDFIAGPKDRIGLMAEDFHEVFGRGPDDKIDGQDVQMALWLAVRELAAQNAHLLAEIEKLKAEN